MMERGFAGGAKGEVGSEFIGNMMMFTEFTN